MRDGKEMSGGETVNVVQTATCAHGLLYIDRGWYMFITDRSVGLCER